MIPTKVDIMRTKNLLAICFLLLAQYVTAAEKQKPNVLFVFADDQCFETLASSGHPVIQTPNLDRLTRQGTTFTLPSIWGVGVERCVSPVAACSIQVDSSGGRMRFIVTLLRRCRRDDFGPSIWHLLVIIPT